MSSSVGGGGGIRYRKEKPLGFTGESNKAGCGSLSPPNKKVRIFLFRVGGWGEDKKIQEKKFVFIRSLWRGGLLQGSTVSLSPPQR